MSYRTDGFVHFWIFPSPYFPRFGSQDTLGNKQFNFQTPLLSYKSVSYLEENVLRPKLV